MLEVMMTETRVEWTGQWLTPGDESSPPSPAAAAIVFILLLRFLLDICLHNLFHVANLDQNVLRLQVRVDDAAFPMQVI